MFDVHDCVSFISGRGAKLIGESLNHYFPPDSITKVQWTALYHIHNREGISQRELAHEMMIKEPTALRLVDRLERDGLVTKRINPKNRRVRHLALTDRGRQLYEEGLPLVVQFNEDAKEGIAEEDMAIFKSVLDRMIENLSGEREKGEQS